MMVRRLFWYLVVGASGIVVNMGVLTLARALFPHWLTMTYLWAVESAIIWNYVWNARFTFRQPFRWLGLGRYNLVSAAGAMIQTALYRYLLSLGWNYLLADLVAIPVATGFGFVFSWIWVFRQRTRTATAPDAFSPQLEVSDSKEAVSDADGNPLHAGFGSSRPQSHR
ncbi:MAG: GtrA family protein [Firmicutes bacterium]|nr:GtrA family protein [Bacillota bacterium]